MIEIICLDKFVDKCRSSGNEITKEEIQGTTRSQTITIARHVYWYILNQQGLGHRKIAQLVGRSKQSVSSGVRTVKNLIDTGSPLIEPYNEVIKCIE